MDLQAVRRYPPAIVKLSDCVAAWLQATGKKQSVVAKKAGMSPSKLSEIATGKNEDPQWSTIEKIARGFEVSVHVFLEGPPRPEKEDPGHARQVGGGSDPIQRWHAEQLRKADEMYPAEDSWRGDIHQAQAALAQAQSTLARALRRREANTNEPPGQAGKAG